jgi:argininosuccinate lyase
VLANVTVNESRTRDAAMQGYMNATELADHLVSKGVPFRTAHETVGRIVLFAIEQGKELHELSLDRLKEFSAEIDDNVFAALAPDATLASKNVIGGTSPARVKEALAAANAYLTDNGR